MPFELRYHPDVRDIDIPSIHPKLRVRIKKAIETRLAVAPHQYGEPLRKTLKGYWKLRVGDYRVVFKIVEHEVWIMGIMDRKEKIISRSFTNTLMIAMLIWTARSLFRTLDNMATPFSVNA